MATFKKIFLLVSVSNVNSRFSKVSRVWLGDLYKQRKLHTFPIHFISKLMDSFKNWISSTFNGIELSNKYKNCLFSCYLDCLRVLKYTLVLSISFN